MPLQSSVRASQKPLRLDDEVRSLRSWIEKPLHMGAVMPSGRLLARTMAQYVDPESEGPVVEPRYTAGDGWHTDVSCDEIPPLASMLYITETPENGGGDTLFADMYAAYDALSDALKERLSGLTARHASAHVFGKGGGYAETDRPELSGHAETPEAVHPVVITHPGSGRKALYVNPTFTREIVGMAPDESQALLGELYAHAVQPQFVGRLRWRPGSMAIWDNRCTWHNAMNDYHGIPGSRRSRSRITASRAAARSARCGSGGGEPDRIRAAFHVER